MLDTTFTTSTSAAVQDRLDRNLSLPRNRIAVRDFHGWIILSGTLDWEFQRDAAEDGLRDLPGVLGVVNRITINPDDDDAADPGLS